MVDGGNEAAAHTESSTLPHEGEERCVTPRSARIIEDKLRILKLCHSHSDDSTALASQDSTPYHGFSSPSATSSFPMACFNGSSAEERQLPPAPPCSPAEPSPRVPEEETVGRSCFLPRTGCALATPRADSVVDWGSLEETHHVALRRVNISGRSGGLVVAVDIMHDGWRCPRCPGPFRD